MGKNNVAAFVAMVDVSDWQGLPVEMKREICGKLGWVKVKNGSFIRIPLRCGQYGCEFCERYREMRKIKNGNEVIKNSIPYIKYMVYIGNKKDWGKWRQRLSRAGCDYLRVPNGTGEYIYTPECIHNDMMEVSREDVEDKIMIAAKSDSNQRITGKLRRGDKQTAVYSRLKIETDYYITSEDMQGLEGTEAGLIELCERLKLRGIKAKLLYGN